MKIQDLVLIDTLSQHYKVEISFFISLDEMGLIEIMTIEKARYIHQDKITDVLKMINMHQELNLNTEGIDIAFNLLEKINFLQQELTAAKNRLRLYEK